MKPITVRELMFMCIKQVDNGNGDKVIMISSDDEGNSYHYLWYDFMSIKEYEKPEEFCGEMISADFEYCNEDIASKENTIILG